MTPSAGDAPPPPPQDAPPEPANQGLDLLAGFVPEPGEWQLVPGTAFNGSRAVLTGNTGGAYDAENHFLYLWGGEDHIGNQVFRLDFEILQATQVTVPTGCAVPFNSPSASPTYDGIVWVPSTQTFFVFPVSPFCPEGSIAPDAVWEFDPATATWHEGPEFDASAAPIFTEYDPFTDRIVVITGGNGATIREFDPATRQFSETTSLGVSLSSGTAVLRPGSTELFVVNDAGIFTVSLTDLGAIEKEADLEDGVDPRSGAAFDAATGRLVLWGGDNTVWTYDPVSSIWAELVGNGPTKADGGVFSKWIYIEELDVYAGYHNPAEGLWLYSLPDAPPEPDQPADTPPQEPDQPAETPPQEPDQPADTPPQEPDQPADTPPQEPENSAPAANAGANLSLQVGDVATLDGSGSFDPDGDPLTYSWSLMTRPAGSAASLSSTTVENPNLTVDVAGTYEAQLVVLDGALGSTPDTVTITVQAPDPDPAAGAGTPASNQNTIHASPSDYKVKLASLQPGDTLQLSSGTYTEGLTLPSLHGEPGKPIIISGPEDRSAVILARSCCNTVEMADASYVVIRNLTLDGQNNGGSHAVNSSGPTHHITIENLEIINHGENRQVVGISTKAPAWDWVIRNNIIRGAGTGIYLGQSNGNSPFVRGLIEHNLIVDTVGYNMQIKHQNPRPTLAGMPTGKSSTVIRYNVFSKANQPSAGFDGPRPNLLVGHMPLSGVGTDDVYEIYGNFFYQNLVGQALFQGEGNIALYDNLFVNNDGDAVWIQRHNDRPKMVRVFHNTVVARDVGISISGGDPSFTQSVIGNAVFAATPIQASARSDNITDSFAAATTYLNNPTSEPETLDLYPRSGMLTGPQINLAQFEPFSDHDLDFNGDVRDGTFRGAYAGEGANPGFQANFAGRPDLGLVPADSPVDDTPPANAVPTADAGADLSVETGQTATLDGRGSVDPDGDSLAYSWELTSKPTGSTAVLLDPTSSRPRLVPDVVGAFVISLVVCDTLSACSAPDQVSVAATQPAGDSSGDDSPTGGSDGTAGDPGDLSLLAEHLPNAGKWSLVPNTRFEMVATSDQEAESLGVKGQSGSECAIIAWNGMAYDPENHVMYFYGGGHHCYAGNEVYSLDLETLEFDRRMPPSPLTDTSTDPECPMPGSGPAATHSYNGFVYSPATGTLFQFSDMNYCSGSDWWGNWIAEFDPVTDTWTRRSGYGGGFRYPGAVWDPMSHEFLVMGGREEKTWRMYDPVAKAWSSAAGPRTAWVDTGDAMYFDGDVYFHHQNALYKSAFALTDPSQWTKVTDYPSGLQFEAGFDVTADGRFVFWDGDSDIWVYDPDQGTWQRLTHSSGPTGEGKVYSKWVYIPELDAFAGYNNPWEGLWIYRLPGSAPPPAPPPSSSVLLSLSVSPNSITEGQSANLAWTSTGATSCSAGDGWSGSKSTSGNESVSPTATTDYTLTCTGTGTGGSVTKSTTLTVTPASSSVSSEGRGVLMSPEDGATFSSSTVTFDWHNNGDAVDEYWLGVASDPSLFEVAPWGDIFSSTVGKNQSATVTGLPTDGRPIYVRLWTDLGNLPGENWVFEDYIFTAATITSDGSSAGDGSSTGDGSSAGDGSSTGDGSSAGDGSSIGDGSSAGDGSSTGGGSSAGGGSSEETGEQDTGSGSGTGTVGTVTEVLVPLTIEELVPSDAAAVARANEPASFGVPLLDEYGITSVDQLGLSGATAAQFRALETYPSGNVKWVLVDTLASLPAGGNMSVTLGTGSGDFGGSDLAVDAGSTIEIDTGRAQFSIRKAGFNVIDRATVDGTTLVEAGHTGGLVLTDDLGVEYSSLYDNPTVTILENGPVKAVVKAEGRFKSSTGTSAEMGYTIYITFYKDQGSAKFGVSLRNAYEATYSTVAFEALELKVPTRLAGGKTFRFPTSGSVYTGNIAGGQSAYLYQGATQRHGGGPYFTQFYNSTVPSLVGSGDVGTKVVNGGSVVKSFSGDDTDDYALGWASVQDSANAGVTVVYQNMDAYFPASIEFSDAGLVSIGIFSKHNSRPSIGMDWATHESRDLMLDFHTASVNNELINARLQMPLFGRASLDHYRSTGAFLGEDRLASYDDQLALYNTSNAYNDGFTYGDRPTRSDFALDNHSREVVRAWRTDTGGTENQRDYMISNMLDYVRVGHGGQMLNALQESLFRSDQFAWRSDDFDFGTKAPNFHDDYGSGGGSTFNGGESAHKHERDLEHIWVYGMYMAYYFTGDERIKEGLVDLAESTYSMYATLDHEWLSYERRGISAARIALLSFMFTGDQRYLDELNERVFQFIDTETGWPNEPRFGRHPVRGYIFVSSRACDYRQYGATNDGSTSSPRAAPNLINLYFANTLRDVLNLLPEDHVFSSPAKPEAIYTMEDFRDTIEGLAYFAVKEMMYYPASGEDPGHPYTYHSFLPDCDFPLNQGDAWIWDPGNIAAMGYELTGDAGFLAKGTRQQIWVDFVQSGQVNSDLGALQLVYNAMHPNETVVGNIALTVTNHGGGSYTLSWTVPAGNGVEYQLKHADKPIVANLNYDKVARTYEFSPSQQVPFWAAENFDGEPLADAEGLTQTLTVSGLSCGSSCFFRLRYRADAAEVLN